MNKIFLAAALTVAAFSANATTELVTNGDFETGTFFGWTKSGNPSLSDVIANTVTSDHTYLWRSGATGSPAYIDQELNTTAGGLYELSFDVYNTATSNSFFSASFGGTTVESFTNEVHNWTHFTFDVVANGTLTDLKFAARNDPSFTRLDNISVVALTSAVPEPGTTAMLLAGLGLMGMAAVRRKA